jgi:predicted site-specific integrase-resolvase
MRSPPALHEDTLRRWWKDGRIIMIRVGPKLLRVPRAEIARLRAAQDFRPHTSA